MLCKPSAAKRIETRAPAAQLYSSLPRPNPNILKGVMIVQVLASESAILIGKQWTLIAPVTPGTSATRNFQLSFWAFFAAWIVMSEPMNWLGPMAFSLESVAQPQTFWNFNIDAGTWHGPCGPVNNKSRGKKILSGIEFALNLRACSNQFARCDGRHIYWTSLKSKAGPHGVQLSRLNSMTRRSVASLGRCYSLESVAQPQTFGENVNVGSGFKLCRRTPHRKHETCRTSISSCCHR